MKTILALLALVALAVAQHDHHDHAEYKVKTREDLIKFRDECVTELNIPAELLEKYKEWKYPDDEKTHCYMKCIFEKFGLFDEKTGFDVHKIHHQLMGHEHADHSDATHAKIEGCSDKNTQGSNACAWAYRGAICFIKENLSLVQKSVSSK